MHSLTIQENKSAPQEEHLRQAAWDNAVHAEATRTVFDRRARRLKIFTMIRDFTCIAIPLMLGYMYSSEQFEAVKPYRNFAIAFLALAALLQILLTLLSLLNQWDKELSYNLRAVRDQYALRVKWSSIGKGFSQNIQRDVDQLTKTQEEYESHDSEKGITDKEKMYGHRAGLVFFDRPCGCGAKPKTLKPPLYVSSRCPHCGDNRGR